MPLAPFHMHVARPPVMKGVQKWFVVRNFEKFRLYNVACLCCTKSSLFQSSREQLAIAEYARSLLTIPKQLAVNAAQDSTDLVAKLRAYHNSSQTKPEHRELKW